MNEGDGQSSVLSGANILVIEDEMLITMLLEDILDELGCKLAGSAANLRQGHELADVTEADAAILDVNLGGEPVFPIAERLVERNIPIIFSSGYGANGLPPKWQSHPTLPKPFTPDQVETVLLRVLATR